MRTLLLMRGSPCSGKSTWIKKNNLQNYTLSADDIRLLYRSTIIDCDGKENIDQSINQKTWKTLFEILEERMKFGEFTIIDACNSKTTEMNLYKSLAEKYRYRIYCLDFTDIPVETAKEWNKLRPEYKQVPENVIDLYYSRFETQKIPSGIKCVNKDNVWDEILIRKDNLNNLDFVKIIGDIHGCNTALQELLKEGIKENCFYIFLGDYIDRGIENKETLEFLMSIQCLPNICMLEGNHEKWIWRYANDEDIFSKEFLKHTQHQIDSLDKKDLRQFYRKLRQCIMFEFNGTTYFCNHGGISRIKNDNPLFTATKELIDGTGDYEEILSCHQSFLKFHPDIIQIHGHRNISVPNKNDNCISLESKVEFGEFLSAVTLSKDGQIIFDKIKNRIFKQQETDIEQSKETFNSQEIKLQDIIEKMRENTETIMERRFDNISSFNFTRNVFRDKKWDNIPTEARGLFINTDNYTIANRSYDKFFNVDEVKETELFTLSTELKFPVDCYVKYNGFLGMLGYDEKNDKLLFCSKSSTGGPFSKYFEEIFMSKYAAKVNDILNFIKTTNTSMVFEVIDPVNDPHIIKYDECKIVLLDIIKREINYNKLKYEDLCNIANKYNIEVKEKAFTINSWSEFMSWYKEVFEGENYKYKDKFIEGFVIEDANGFMTKLKGYYYRFWKLMRSVKDEVFRKTKNGFKGYIDHTSKLYTEESNLFYGFIKSLAERNYNEKTDIISLRDLFIRDKEVSGCNLN